ncbi:MAG: hypothetical protein KDB00_16170 [Planctomycetales bacterium]|nr:hypothetical protein [Planctomycetales bacterium]
MSPAPSVFDTHAPDSRGRSTLIRRERKMLYSWWTAPNLIDPHWRNRTGQFLNQLPQASE